MKRIIKKLPLPITGLMLALAALGNLVQSYGETYRNILGGLAGLIVLLVVGKALIYPKDFKEALDNVVVASVFPTFSMGIMLLATYLKPVSAGLAYGVWLGGLGLHIALMVRFTLKHVLDFNIKKVFPSWFIVYVGIVVGAITAPAFGKLKIGQGLFYFGFLSLLILLPIVLRRVLIVKEIPGPALPTIAILTAPAALCLAGYMNSFPEKSMVMVYFLLGLSQILYIFVLGQMPRLLKEKFSPAYSAFTFPLVITGVSIKLTNGFLMNSGRGISLLKALVKFEELVAVLLVAYVLVRYTAFLLAGPPVEKEVKNAEIQG